MISYNFLLALATILLSTKVFGVLSKRVHLPQVVGALIAGILLGPTFLNFVVETEFLSMISQIGVILLMFLSGLDTDIAELKRNFFPSLFIAISGVIIPLVGGYFVYNRFFADSMDELHFIKALFVGIMLTATSVSITVETLREMGKLDTKVGATILGAAIIDDIFGIIILTCIISLKDSSVKLSNTFFKIIFFFIFILIVGFFVRFIFKRFPAFNENRQRVAIYGFAFCLVMAYISEVAFGITDITGAYFAGIILCNLDFKKYIAKKINIISYMFFGPIFFASIGLKAHIKDISPEIINFSIVLLVVAILTKVIGCSVAAMLCKFSKRDALTVGIGMVSRGEIALIVAQKGLAASMLDITLFPAVIIVTIVTTLITPILLKLVLKNSEKKV